MSRPAEIEDLLGIVEGGLAGSKVEAESTDPMDCSFSASLPVATIALRAFGECTATQLPWLRRGEPCSSHGSADF
jgi:hypothetical protein